jgi:hypothetical protein
MTKESRAILISVLIVFAYSSSLFIEFGTWIFPFPMFDYILFVIAILFAIWNKEQRTLFALFAGICLLRIFGDSFAWTFFLSGASLYIFLDSMTIVWIRLSEALLMIPFIFILFRFKDIREKVTAIALVSLHILSLIPPFSMMNYAFFMAMTLTYAYVYGTKKPTFYLLLLTGIFDLIEGYSVLFTAH